MSQSKLYLSHENRGRPLTREEFSESAFEEPWRYERAKGKLVAMNPPGFEHHRTVKWFRNHLGAYELAHSDVVEDVFQEGWVAIDEETDRIPDIQVFLRSNSDDRRFPERVPDLIFEIVSQGPDNRRRDYEDKRRDYERLGEQEYVIVDRFAHRVTVLRLQQGEFVETILAPDDNYTTPLLPGLEIPLAGIF